MYLPRQCTQNTQSHVDYGIPLVAAKPDFRTSYKRGHSFIPGIAQDYDCRINTKIHQDLLETNIILKDDRISSHQKDYIKKSNPDIQIKSQLPNNNTQLHYIRNLQEALTKCTPPSARITSSEMKDNYRWFPYKTNLREVIPPAISSICEITGLAKPIQPAIPPNEVGAWKYLDNYMTTNKLHLVPYNQNQINDANTDFPTFYNTSGVYNKSKRTLPAAMTGNKSVYDKAQFKFQFPIKNIARGQKRVPHSGMQSEYQGRYVLQTYSDVYPYTGDSGQISPPLILEAGPWQNLCPPGMYCTEYCHIGSGWPVRAVVGSDERKFSYSSEKCEPIYECVKDNQ